MSRLTEKYSGGYVITNKEDFTENSYQVIQKLGKLEDLEEQIGCPLEVVIRAVRDGIYIKNVDGETVNFKCELYYKNPELGWYFLIINGYVPLTDYKNKFWLKKDKSE